MSGAVPFFGNAPEKSLIFKISIKHQIYNYKSLKKMRSMMKVIQ